ncbi:tyrosine-type recombinase/integrase [Tessaracoccus antarcticus]|uniref:Tyr recombinase domain-containing protein n=1 Tax=Tessaracoccus antarcticus TaxID=2479848 RepID=A0A3M0G1M3_9ACTN|nr:tyrosine-type recombinase/integrase [Tessaracoccus antarcticus]RMB58881.1 hypothetical protein EAX62_12265 [Tessaracoccus antarcticus]
MPRVRRPRTKARPVPEPVLQTFLTSHDPRISLGSRLAASAGLRRSEIIVVHLDDFREDLLGRSLLVHGKGGTDRLVPLADGLDSSIRSYVAAHHITGYLFPGECDGHIGSNWLGKLINQQLPPPWNLHGLRHRFATTIYQQTHDIIVVQQLLGHESVATTQRYLAHNGEQLRRAVNLADTARTFRAARADGRHRTLAKEKRPMAALSRTPRPPAIEASPQPRRRDVLRAV